jgi:hypothetical protein
MSPKVFNTVDDSVRSTERTYDSNLLIGKVSDHSIASRQRKRTMNLLLASLSFSLSSFIFSFALKVFLSLWYLKWMSGTIQFYWRNTRLTSPLWAHSQTSLTRSLNTFGNHLWVGSQAFPIAHLVACKSSQAFCDSWPPPVSPNTTARLVISTTICFEKSWMSCFAWGIF